MKKAIFCMIAIAIVGLLITSVSSVPVQETNKQDLSLTVTALDLEPQIMSVPTTYVEQKPTELNKMPSLGIPAFEGPGNQLHPAISLTGSLQMVAFFDEDLGNIVWDYSDTGGPPYSGGVYYDNGGDYPSVKYWGLNSLDETVFFGTFVTSYLDLNGAPTYLFKTVDPTDSALYEMVYWDWSSYGWSDMKDADIACDNSQEEWAWGISAYVTSTTYGNTYTDGPTITYATDEGTGTISWYYVDGCAHTDVSIDHSTIYAYAVYDWYDPDLEYWRLLCREKDFSDVENGPDSLYDFDTGGNVEYPAVAAENGNIVIVAQTDVNGNSDIICLYGSSMTSLSTTYVADSGDDEMFPDIRYVSGDTFLCTYVKGNALYGKTSDDAGATWGSEVMLSDGAEEVVEEYKTSDLSENAVKAMYEVEVDESDNLIDIFITDVVSNDPPGDPTISGPSVGSPDKQFDFQFTATDPDGDQVKFRVNWGDGSEETTALTPSGTPITASHTWAEKGSYVITATAIDEKGEEGGASTHDIVIPRGKSVNNFVLRILERYISMFPIFSQLLGL